MIEYKRPEDIPELYDIDDTTRRYRDTLHQRELLAAKEWASGFIQPIEQTQEETIEDNIVDVDDVLLKREYPTEDASFVTEMPTEEEPEETTDQQSLIEKGWGALSESAQKVAWPFIAPFVKGSREENPIVRGMVTGIVEDAPNGILGLARDVVNGLGGEYNEEDWIKVPEILQSNPDSTTEGVVRGLTQFMSIFGAVGGIGKGANIFKQTLAGGLADATFDPTEGNIGTLLRELNVDNAVTQFLDSKVGEDADALERLQSRAKNVLEGAGIGFAVPTLISGIRWAKENAKTFMSDLLDKVDEISAQLPESQMSANFGQTQAVSPQRVGTTGQYIGAPEGINTPQALGKLRRNMTALAKQGEEGRFWYERSGQAILDATGGNIEEAEKIAQAIAVTSAGSTPVGMNMEFALQAYNQFKAGEPIMTGKFPKAMIPRLESIFRGEGWEGRKTNTFYNNLMATIDPKRSQGVTVDMHMMRVFGFKTDAPSPKQYDFVEDEINRISNELGWNNYQTQAAIWVAQKANRANKPVTEMKFDYSDAINKTMGQISWETKPSASSGHLKEIFDAPMSEQTEFHYAMSKALTDDNGQDVIAKELGILSPGSFDAPGVFEGTISPGTQTQVLMPKKYKGQLGQVDEATLDLVEMYSAVRGILLKQDGVGYHRPFWEKSVKKRDMNGIDANIGRPLEPEEAQQLDSIISEVTGLNYLSPVSTDTGFRLINFSDLDNKEYEKLMRQVLDRFEISDKIQVKQFAAQTGYVGNDWSKNKNGELYLGGRFEGRPDIQQRIRAIVKKYNARVEAVEDDFSDKYGWTKGEFNTEYKTPEINSNTQNMPSDDVTEGITTPMEE